jgi:methylmalonyl-CoA mutase cobalamin-binding subunit/predicted DNA-binding transcriptional regulator AlpA
VNAQADVPPNTGLLSVTEVERLTGIRQATLRMWEKRYGFPQPLRDRHGDRAYPLSQVERLQAVRRLMDQGNRPGKILAGDAILGGADLARLRVHTAAIPPQYVLVFDLLRGYHIAELHAQFQYRLLDLGLRRFVIEFLAPLTTAVGVAWSQGDLPMRCEHLFVQLAISTLTARQAAVRTAGDGHPKVLLATLSGEAHTLGIMMAEAVLATLGVGCIQLGGDLPPQEVAAAAQEAGADIVALSFSACFPGKSLIRMLHALRGAVPDTTAIWAGGEGVPAPALLGPGIDVFRSLGDIEPAVLRYRERHRAP